MSCRLAKRMPWTKKAGRGEKPGYFSPCTLGGPLPWASNSHQKAIFTWSLLPPGKANRTPAAVEWSTSHCQSSLLPLCPVALPKNGRQRLSAVANSEVIHHTLLSPISQSSTLNSPHLRCLMYFSFLCWTLTVSQGHDLKHHDIKVLWVLPQWWCSCIVSS